MLPGVVFDTEGFDDDVQELFRYGDDGTEEVHRWVNDVQWNAFRGPAKVGRVKICQLGRDVETRNAFTTSTERRSTDLLRHIASEIEGRGDGRTCL